MMYTVHRFAALTVLLIATCVASLRSTEYLAEYRLPDGGESVPRQTDPDDGTAVDVDPDAYGVDYFFGLDGFSADQLHAVTGASENPDAKLCPWSKTGMCFCGESAGGGWEFSCPAVLDVEDTDPVTVGHIPMGGTHGLGSAGDDRDGSQDSGSPDFRHHGLIVHSYPVGIHFQPGTHVLVKCSLDAVPDDFRYLKDHDLKKVSSVEFYSCPPPSTNETYSSLIASMGIPIGDVEYLVIRDVTRGGFKSSNPQSPNATSPKISAAMFAGLSNLTQLSIRTAGVDDLPSNLLSGFPRLTALDLAENELPSLQVDLLKVTPQLTMLDLRSNALEEIPEGFFRDSKALETLYLNGNRLKQLNATSLLGLGKLEVLELRSNQLGPTITKSALDAVPELKWLSLANNSLESLPGDLFSATPHIERLIIAMNGKLTELPDGLLLPLANLSSLSLDRNGLSTVPERLLANATKLVNLTMTTQQLTTIPNGFFNNCQSLEKLDLRSNKIADLPDETFVGLTALRQLNLDNNKLNSISEALFSPLKSLEVLILSRNNLTTMAARALRSNVRLLNIDVSDNALYFNPSKSPTPFGDCIELQVLNLEKNRFEYIHDEWRTSLARLQELRLRFNNITRVSYDSLGFVSMGLTVDLRNNNISKMVFYDRATLEAFSPSVSGDDAYQNGRNSGGETRVMVSGNPLSCDCELYEFVQYLSTTSGDKRRVVIGGATELKCASPWNLVNVSLTQAPLESLTCNITTDCPSGCACVVQPHGNNVIVRCQGALKGLLTRLPQGTSILHLENNTVTSLSQVLNNSALTSTLKEVYLEGNRLTTFDLNPETVPRALSLLDVSFNNLTRVSTEKLVRLVQIAPDLSLRLSGNPWQCDCETRPFFDFVLEKFTRIKDFDSVRCAGNGRRLSELAPEDLCPEAWRRTVWATSTLGVLFVTLLFLTAAYIKYGFYLRAWLYARKWGLPLIALHDKLTRRMEDEEGCSFDAFISYSSKDEDFVVGELSHGLEHGNPPYKLNLHFRDWKPGEFVQDQVYTAVSQSRRTLVILSENYVNSIWGRAEFRVAHTRALQDRIDRVVVILYGDMPDKDAMDESLRTYVNLKTYLKWGDSLFWERLRYALSRPLTSKKSMDPNASEMGIVNKGLDPV